MNTIEKEALHKLATILKPVTSKLMTYLRSFDRISAAQLICITSLLAIARFDFERIQWRTEVNLKQLVTIIPKPHVSSIMNV